MTMPSVVLEKFRTLDLCLERIRNKIGTDYTRLEDLDIQDIVLLNLQRACQLAIDVAAIIIRDKKLELPATLREYFELLGRHAILSPATSEKLARMIGFRNLAVHDYEKIDIAILKAIIQKNLGDFELFQREILAFYTAG